MKIIQFFLKEFKNSCFFLLKVFSKLISDEYRFNLFYKTEMPISVRSIFYVPKVRQSMDIMNAWFEVRNRALLSQGPHQQQNWLDLAALDAFLHPGGFNWRCLPGRKKTKVILYWRGNDLKKSLWQK